MSTPRPDVSVIIVSWNTEDLLRDCVQSIKDETSRSCEIIVVDNASADGSVAMVRREFPEVVLIANDDNRGFAGANNQGLTVSTGEKVLLLNPDTVVLDGAIDTMCDWLDAHPDVGCVGCQVWEDADTIQLTSFAEPGPLSIAVVEFGLRKFFPWPEYGGWDRKSQRDVDVVSGMFMLVPRHVMDKVGILDDAFFVYSEEADWCRRIRDAGWRCVFAPEAKILHLEGGSKSTEQIKSRMFVQKQKSKMIYVAKHYGPLGRFAARSVFVLSAGLRVVLFGTLGLIRPSADRKARVRLSKAALNFHLRNQEPTS